MACKHKATAYVTGSHIAKATERAYLGWVRGSSEFGHVIPMSLKHARERARAYGTNVYKLVLVEKAPKKRKGK